MIKLLKTITFCALALTSLSQAANLLLEFSDLNNTADETTNSATVSAGATITSITRSTVDTDDTQLAYVVDIGGETLTFNVLVEAFSGTTYTDSFTTTGATTGSGGSGQILGSSSTTVSEYTAGTISNGFGVGSTGVNAGETLKFSITDLSYTGTGTVVFDGFVDAFVQEAVGNNHRAVVGIGSDLFERQWQVGSALSMTTDNATDLYISASRASNSGGWGVSSLDFNISIVPEPSSMTLLALGLSGLLVIRRRSRQA